MSMKRLLVSALLVAASATSAAAFDLKSPDIPPGGGPLAANLAKAGHSVLLLEAGGVVPDGLVLADGVRVF